MELRDRIRKVVLRLSGTGDSRGFTRQIMEEIEATESGSPSGQAEFDLLTDKFGIALEAIQKIACGTEDVEPPFRAMPLSNMRSIARHAYREIMKLGS